MRNHPMPEIKNTLFLVLMALVLCFSSGWIVQAFSQEARSDSGNNSESRIQEKFQQIDTDGGGTISASEMAAHEAEIGKTGGNRFSGTDTDGDGAISLDEFIQHEKGRNERGPQRRGAPGNETESRSALPPEGQQSLNRNFHNTNASPSAPMHQGSKYSLVQAVSDRAQLNTIAFNGLAFLTGDFGAATFIPPGKVCDFFGFQYMRDIDAAGKGHNPMFLNRVAGNVLTVLNSTQKKMFFDLAKTQAPQMEKLAKMRLGLIKAFHLQRDNQIPAGSNGLNQEKVIHAVGELFARDAELSLERAEVMAAVALSLTPHQKAYLRKMKFGDFNTWPAVDERGKLRREGRGKSKMVNVAYMTYASEFFSWIAGSLKADVYFCPERHGTYFGGFYMKDMPAMGKRDYDISTTVTGNSGETFLRILTADQRRHITRLTGLQKDALSEIIEVREKISRELRKYLAGQSPDKAAVVRLGRRYGELDGEVSYLYAMAFAQVNQALSFDQRQTLMDLRNLDGYKSAAYYVYSQPIQRQPNLKGVDDFFTGYRE